MYSNHSFVNHNAGVFSFNQENSSIQITQNQSIQKHEAPPIGLSISASQGRNSIQKQPDQKSSRLGLQDNHSSQKISPYKSQKSVE